MKLAINDNVFWVLFWLFIASCTASNHHNNTQVKIAALESHQAEKNDAKD